MIHIINKETLSGGGTKPPSLEPRLAVCAAQDLQDWARALVCALRQSGLDCYVAWVEQEVLLMEPQAPDSTGVWHVAAQVLGCHGYCGQYHVPVGSVCFEYLGNHEARALLLLTQNALPLFDENQLQLLRLAGARLNELRQLGALLASVSRLEHSEQLQRALFKIADMASSPLSLQNLLHGLHAIIATLMYAENFYIALYDEERDTLRFIYFADEKDGKMYDDSREYPAAEMSNTITLRMIRRAQAMRGPSFHVAASLGLDKENMVGTPSVDFMGVPMLRDGRVMGLLTVQSYKPGRGYNQEDQNLLAFVADHVLNALERKLGQQALERRVVERTQELAQANAMLLEKILESQHAAQLQATMYRIAALGHSHRIGEDFYPAIHQAVGKLLSAENFFIALLSEDRTKLTFPYFRSTIGERFQERKLGLGMSEYLIRLGKTVLMDKAQIDVLIANGEVDEKIYGIPALSWLGAPLLGSDGVIGVVVMQSYRPKLSFTRSDADLLTFVSSQIASTVQRRQQDILLKKLNSELERRVEERTQQLSAEIAEREKIQEQLRYQVMHDPLTSLPNRLYIRDCLQRALEAYKRDDAHGFALMYLDVDHFKSFNDSYGHNTGDVVLKEVAQRLIGSVRSPDVVSRLSGDEFCILLADCHSAKCATMVADRIINSMRAPVSCAERALRVTVSIGVALAAGRHRNVDELFHDADLALYEAKFAGRQCYALFDDPKTA